MYKREILFKALSIDENIWVEGSLYIDSESKYYILSKSTLWYTESDETEMRSLYSSCATKVITGTICQFTGQHDKKKNKIFEDDIVRGKSNNLFSFGDINDYQVIFGIDRWHIKGTNFCLQELFNYCNNDIEVIGNIHKK